MKYPPNTIKTPIVPTTAPIRYAPGERHLPLRLIPGDDPSINQEVMDGQEMFA
jgi:hypothetical protein